MAAAAPGATFVGVDLSPRQVAAGEALRAAAGLGNASLLLADVATLGPQLGTFDYVIAHGLYSWIPESAADALLALAGKVLSPNGVAYVSYNTYPGWHLRGLVRDLLLRGTAGASDPGDRLARARDLLAFVSANCGDRNAAYGIALRDVAEQFSRLEDAYLFHEWLESENRPCWFLDFAARAARHGLEPLADAHLAAMPMGRAKPDVDDLLSSRVSGRLEKEELLDVLRNRAFRQTLLVRAPAPGREEPDPSALEDLVFTTELAPAAHDGPGTMFRSASASLATDNPGLVAALRALQAAAPRALSLAAFSEGTADGLGEALLRCVASGLVEVRADDVPCASSPGPFPLATPLARLQAAGGGPVASLAHRNIDLDPSGRLLIVELDGSPRESVAGRLARSLVRHGLLVAPGGRAPSDEDARSSVVGQLDAALASLARRALLVQ
jgi:SAM-dependent methyltransferase